MSKTAKNQIKPKAGINKISPYVGGAAKLAGHADVLKLSSNENLSGPSPKAREAFASAATKLHLYPSATHLELREAIAEVFDLDAERILCGAGSDEIISLLCNAYAGPRNTVIHTEHGFEMYKISALAAGATPIAVPEKERHTDVDAILAACDERTRLVFLANPNNPTGTMIGADEIARLADNLPPKALLVLDGAYAEYVPDFDAGAALVKTRDNVIMTRTFSKIFGLGSLRIGWCFGPDHVIDTLNRVRGPFNVNAAALAAAEAAVRDTAYTARCREDTAKWRDWLATDLAKIGIPSDPAFGNFILARLSSDTEAQALDAHLKSIGIIVRMVPNYNLPHCLRITIGDEIACRRVASAVRDFKVQTA